MLRINPLTGTESVIATNFNHVQAMVMLKGYLYVINNGYMVKVNPTSGASTTIGVQRWLTATSLAYMDGFFYILTNNAIYSLLPDKETVTSLALVTNGSELVAMGGYLYYISNDLVGGIRGIYKMKPFQVSPWRINSTQRSTEAQMTAYQGSLYVADGGYLYKVGVGGSETNITYGWTNTQQFTALQDYNY